MRVADEIKETENSLKSRIIKKFRSMWKKSSTSAETSVSPRQVELIRTDNEDPLEGENDTEEDTKKDR